MTYSIYGSSEVLQLQELEKPVPKANEVLVKIHAVSINSSDRELLNGKPLFARLWGFFKPRFHILGSDIAGTVVDMGENVVQFKPGDTVFGDIFLKWGGFAEYVCVPQSLLYNKPDSFSFEEIAALPQAGVVALQGIQYNGIPTKAQEVLIIGAGGGAGSYAIQLAKMKGAKVTGVDSEQKLDLMRRLGADHVIDYKKEDFSKNKQRYDLIFDIVGSHSILKMKSILKSKGAYVIAGGSTKRVLQALFLGPLFSLLTRKKMGLLMHKQNKADLDYMIALKESGKVAPVIDKFFALTDLKAAFEYFGKGLALGKIVITMDETNGCN